MDADPAAVEAHLRRLDPDALAALVADLWAARGYDTRQEGGRVRATRGGGTVVLGVAGRATGDQVDVLVAPRGGRRAERVAAAADARLLDAAGLRETLWYAVDPDTARRLCERHLGAAPADLSVPSSPRRRVARAAAASRRAARGLRSGAARRVAGLLVLVAVLAVAGAALPLVADRVGSVAAGPATPAETPASVPTATPRPVYPGLDRLPGLTAAGLRDPAALAAAHRRALGTEYVAWLDVYWRANGTGPEYQRDVDVAVAGDRYRLAAEVGTDDADREPALAVYRENDTRYVADYTGTTSYRAVPRSEPSPTWVPEPDRLAVVGYLAAGETNVTGVVEREGRRYYRVVATGTPPTPVPGVGPRPVAPDEVRNYTAVALVGRRGLVADFEARYMVPTRSGRTPVRFQVTYDRGQRPGVVMEVDRPTWYGRAVNASSPPATE